MTKIIHPVAGAVALLTITTFWLSTVLSELFASEAAVIAVKTAIPWGFLLLIPALAAVGGSGFALAKGRRVGLVGNKAKRMPFIAANGVNGGGIPGQVGGVKPGQLGCEMII